MLSTDNNTGVYAKDAEEAASLLSKVKTYIEAISQEPIETATVEIGASGRWYCEIPSLRIYLSGMKSPDTVDQGIEELSKLFPRIKFVGEIDEV